MSTSLHEMMDAELKRHMSKCQSRVDGSVSQLKRTFPDLSAKGLDQAIHERDLSSQVSEQTEAQFRDLANTEVKRLVRIGANTPSNAIRQHTNNFSAHLSTSKQELSTFVSILRNT